MQNKFVAMQNKFSAMRNKFVAMWNKFESSGQGWSTGHVFHVVFLGKAQFLNFLSPPVKRVNLNC